MSPSHIPQNVLSQSLAEAVNGRRVRAAVFTTYTFDPGFFESHILPVLFDKPFSQEEKVKLIQMEDALQSLDDIAVYYDRSALSQEATPAQLDYRRIDVRRKTGAFHPKLILLLIENVEDGVTDLSLVVSTLSANLTRAGWWENVETGHFEEVWDKNYRNSTTSIRKDLMGTIRRLKNCCTEDEEHDALDRIHRFLLDRANKNEFEFVSYRSEYNTRLFCGQKDLPSWLEEFNIHRHCRNLEIISPFYDKSPVRAIERLIDAVDPARTLVYLPKSVDGSAAISKKSYEAVKAMDNVFWADLPVDVLRPGGRKGVENAPPRRVHAKIYRFWSKEGANITLTGSVNMTKAGHSHSNAGNFEAAFLCDIGKGYSHRSWLEPIEKQPGTFDETQSKEIEESQDVPIDITFQYNWAYEKLQYRTEGGKKGSIAVWDPGGIPLFSIELIGSKTWIDCDKENAEKVRNLLKSTSFLEIRHTSGTWRVLVREEGMSHRPSILLKLTPQEILMYWSLLSPAQQEYFIMEKLVKEGVLPDLHLPKSNRYNTSDTVFDRFAGTYHAFERLVTHIDNALKDGEEREAISRLFGAKYDSLPQLLQKIVNRDDSDPVLNYVTFLCATQTYDRIKREHPDFIKTHMKDARHLRNQLNRLPGIRGQIQVEGGNEFLSWYEKMFLKRIAQPQAEGEE